MSSHKIAKTRRHIERLINSELHQRPHRMTAFSQSVKHFMESSQAMTVAPWRDGDAQGEHRQLMHQCALALLSGGGANNNDRLNLAVSETLMSEAPDAVIYTLPQGEGDTANMALFRLDENGQREDNPALLVTDVPHQHRSVTRAQMARDSLCETFTCPEQKCEMGVYRVSQIQEDDQGRLRTPSVGEWANSKIVATLHRPTVNQFIKLWMPDDPSREPVKRNAADLMALVLSAHERQQLSDQELVAIAEQHDETGQMTIPVDGDQATIAFDAMEARFLDYEQLQALGRSMMYDSLQSQGADPEKAVALELVDSGDRSAVMAEADEIEEHLVAQNRMAPVL